MHIDHPTLPVVLPKPANGAEPATGMRVILTLGRPYAARLAVVAALTVAASASTLSIPWLAGTLTGRLIEQGAGGTARLVTLLVLAIVGSTALAALVRIVSGDTTAHILADLRARLYAHLQRLPIDWHVSHRQGDVLSLMTSEIAHVGNFLTSTLVGVPPLLLTAAGAALLMIRIDPVLALLAPVLVPAYFVLFRLAGRRLRQLGVQEQEAEAGVLAMAEDNLGAIAAIKSFTREDVEDARYRRCVDAARQVSVRLNRFEALIEPVGTLAAALAALTLLMLVGGHLHQGRLSTPDLFSFLFYAALLTRPVAALADTWGQIQVTRGTLARMGSVLATPAEPGHAGPRRLIRAKGRIRFEGVHFAYPGRPAVLQNLNLTIEPGEKLAILGENGAGKTTLIGLLLRFYDPGAGRITIDGHDISGINVNDLRRQVALVPQRPELLSATVRGNIAFGREGASDAEIEEAARRADALEFIGALPQGFDTEIGDRGVRLSGGQGQRIALARALLKDAPIVVLDEATSMYDPDGEERFVETCTRILKDRTVLIITHRPASITLADRIIRL